MNRRYKNQQMMKETRVNVNRKRGKGVKRIGRQKQVKIVIVNNLLNNLLNSLLDADQSTEVRREMAQQTRVPRGDSNSSRAAAVLHETSTLPQHP